MSRPSSSACWCCPPETAAAQHREALSADQWEGAIRDHDLEQWRPATLDVASWCVDFRRRMDEALRAWADSHASRARLDLITRLRMQDSFFDRSILPLWPSIRRSGLSGKAPSCGSARRKLEQIRKHAAELTAAIVAFTGRDFCQRCLAPIEADPWLDQQLDQEAFGHPESPAPWVRRLRDLERARDAAMAGWLAAQDGLDAMGAAMGDGRGQPPKLPAQVLARVLLSIARIYAPPPNKAASKGPRGWSRSIAGFVHDLAEDAEVTIVCEGQLRRILREPGGSDAPATARPEPETQSPR